MTTADELRLEVDHLRTALEDVAQNDRTLPYDYGEQRHSDHADPPRGCRWMTPRELAQNALRRSRGRIG